MTRSAHVGPPCKPPRPDACPDRWLGHIGRRQGVRGGRTGEAAKSVANVLEPHFANENAYALPPLGLLVPLSQGKFECNMTEVLKMTDKLEAAMATMLSEHKDIEAALKKLKDAATAEKKPAGVQFAEHLAAHAQTEEEITYPTALLIGLYVKSKATQCGR